MKVVLLLSLLAGASSFGVVSPSLSSRHAFVAAQLSDTALRPAIPIEDQTPENKQVNEISEKWAKVRFLSREEAESTLEPEWLEAYNRFYTKYEEDMVQMADLAGRVAKILEPPKVQKKTEGQRKRDAFARKQAREKARAAARA